MTRRKCSLTAIAGLMFAMSMGIGVNLDQAEAGGPILDSVLGIDQPDCCHVMDLLVRNRARRFAGHGAPVGINVLGAPQPGDLELLEVSLLSDGNVGQGPIFQVSFRNTSRCTVHGFQLSVVGILERITPYAPCRSIRIPCINAGETKCIPIQLPARCMTLGPHGGPLTPFDTLVVALDSLDELVECNELNNVAILRRADIRVVVAQTPATAQVPATAVAPGTTNPAVAPSITNPQATPPAESIAPAPAPGDQVKPSPIENIDLDKLDLDDAQETAAQIRPLR